MVGLPDGFSDSGQMNFRDIVTRVEAWSGQTLSEWDVAYVCATGGVRRPDPTPYDGSERRAWLQKLCDCGQDQICDALANGVEPIESARMKP
jgi:hypothetical protein